MQNRRRFSAWLFTGSMLGYVVWLMLPAVQVHCKAVTGVLMLVIFAAGVLLDTETLKAHWREFALRAACAAAIPPVLLLLLNRGGTEPLGYLAQQAMFWYPLLWCALAARYTGETARKLVLFTMLAAFAVTTLTTIGWLVEGVFREEGKIYAYARSLGSGEANRQAYLNELMGRNIGGYGFVYASVFALPLTFHLAGGKGWKRVVFTALAGLQLVMIVLSQYTYAMVFAAAITGVEAFGLLFRKIFRKLSLGMSLLCAVPLITALFFLRVPLVTGLSGLAQALHFDNLALSLSQLRDLLTGGAVAEGSRLEAYATSYHSFLASPWVGGIFSGQARLGMHAETLDLLAGLGILGTAGFLGLIYGAGHGVGREIWHSKITAHLLVQWAAFLAFATLDTVFYAREISLVLCLSIVFAVWTDHKKQGIMEPV